MWTSGNKAAQLGTPSHTLRSERSRSTRHASSSSTTVTTASQPTDSRTHLPARRQRPPRTRPLPPWSQTVRMRLEGEPRRWYAKLLSAQQLATSTLRPALDLACPCGRGGSVAIPRHPKDHPSAPAKGQALHPPLPRCKAVARTAASHWITTASTPSPDVPREKSVLLELVPMDGSAHWPTCESV